MLKKVLTALLLTLLPLIGRAQYNIDRLMTSGEVALHYEDYILSIQYFNRIIALKPYLYQPWYYRAVDKFYLDDYVGAESDVSEAISLNPYVHEMYDLRAISRIRQNKFQEAAADYDKAINISPMQQGYWYNRAVCLMQAKDYDKAMAQTDSIARKWSKFAGNYSLKAEICLQQKDTVQAGKWLDKSLELDPYNGDTWTTKSYISLSRKQWKDADAELSKAIHLKPKVVNNYINRALARLNVNNLRGGLEDYDTALDLDPDNFLAHYNRGLLRMQLGDDNRAITDFDYVIRMEPQNFMAIFNRALLLDRTGDLRGAIRDYSKVIEQFPNFWTGLSYRARCYRRLGMTAKAELDEFRIFKAQMDKHLGVQPRWSKNKIKQMRKRSEIDPDKYNDLVVEDEAQYQHEYKSEYRGRVQNRQVEVAFIPMFHASFVPYSNGVNTLQPFDHEVDEFNDKRDKTFGRHLYLNCAEERTTDATSKSLFAFVDELSSRIDAAKDFKTLRPLLLQRAVAYSTLQNYDAAISDLTASLQNDSSSALLYWTRAYCQTMLNQFDRSKGVESELKVSKAKEDFERAIALNGRSAYLHYNLANLYATKQDYAKAIDEYTLAISLDGNLSEAYYNRGLARIYSNNKKGGIADLSKAGELGLYDAYSVIKRYSATEKTKK